LAKDAVLIIGTENFYITGAKCKEIVNISSEDKVRLWPLKKTKGK